MKLFVQAPNAFSFHSIIRSEVYTITVPKSSIFDQVSLFVSHFRKQTNKQANTVAAGGLVRARARNQHGPGFSYHFILRLFASYIWQTFITKNRYGLQVPSCGY